MSEPITYHIETVEDLLKVPPERLEALFTDLREGLVTVHAVKNLGTIVGEIQGIPDPSKAVEFKYFDWKDDGKTGGSRTIIMETKPS